MRHTHWTGFSSGLCALLLWLGLQTIAAAQTQPPAASPRPPATLTELEGWAQDAAPAIALSQAELALATQREHSAHASQGARLFGGASLASAREAVTDTLSRDYQRAQVQVGVRWPLLGSREAQLRALGTAGLAPAIVEGASGRAHGVVDVLFGAGRHAVEYVFGGRVDDLQVAAQVRADPLAVDV